MLSLSLVGAMLIGVAIPLQRTLHTYQRALNIQDAITHIEEESLSVFYEAVLSSRCLVQDGLSMSTITMPASDGLATYQVRYRQDGQPHTPPRDIEIEVTLDASQSLVDLSYYLSPDEIAPPSTLRFYIPIVIEQPDWSGWNLSTGCFEYSS